MEEILEQCSNESTNLFYRAQIKSIEVSQVLQIQGTRLSQNEIKNITNQNLNVFGMTEKLFSQKGLSHLFDLLKQLTVNYNSIIVLLTQKIEKDYQMLQEMNKIHITPGVEELGKEAKREEVEERGGKGMKGQKMGGVSLYNQNYSRNLEDRRILDQIQIERELHIRHKRQDLIDSIFVQELNLAEEKHESEKEDEVTQYILDSKKKKNRVYKVTSYEPELRNIMDFFQNAQTDAKEFLAKRGRGDKRTSDYSFSFSQFQREVHGRQMEFKKEALDKIKNFLQKLRLREKEVETYLEIREAHFREIEEKLASGQERQTQTDFAFEQYLKRNELQKRQLEIRCSALQSLKGNEQIFLNKENNWKFELSMKQKEIQKYILNKKELEKELGSLRKIIRDQRSRKFIALSDKSEKIIQAKNEDKGKEVVCTQQNTTPEKLNQEFQKTYSSGKPSTTGQQHWKRKSKDATSSNLSVNQLGIEEKEIASGHYIKRKITALKHNINLNRYQNKQEQSKTSGIVKGMSTSAGMQTEEEENYYGYYGQEVQPDIITSFNGRLDHRVSQESSKGEAVQLDKTHDSNKRKDEEVQPKRSSKKRQSRKEGVGSSRKSKRESDLKLKPESKKESRGSSRSSSSSRTQPKLQTLPLNKTQKLSQQFPQDSTDEFHLKRQRRTYQMFEVLQQKQEQNQSMHNTQRNNQFVDKRQLSGQYNSGNTTAKEIEKVFGYCTYRKLYNLTIFPRGEVDSEQKSISTRPNISQIQREDKERLQKKSAKMLKGHNRSCTQNCLDSIGQNEKDRISALLDKLPHGSSLSRQGELMKKWKNQILDKYKADMLSGQEVQNIVKVLYNSTQSTMESTLSSNITNQKGFDSHMRSLPQLNPKQLLRQAANGKKMAKKSLLDKNILQNLKLQLQDEQKINNLIRESALQSNFPSKFEQIHKKCKEGPVCSHIMRYIQTVMKQIQDLKNRQRQSLTMHVQNIGQPFEQEEVLQPVAKEQSIFSSSRTAFKETSSKDNLMTLPNEVLNKVPMQSLHKVKNNKKLGLPFIKEGKGATVHK